MQEYNIQTQIILSISILLLLSIGLGFGQNSKDRVDLLKGAWERAQNRALEPINQKYKQELIKLLNNLSDSGDAKLIAKVTSEIQKIDGLSATGVAEEDPWIGLWIDSIDRFVLDFEAGYTVTEYVWDGKTNTKGKWKSLNGGDTISVELRNGFSFVGTLTEKGKFMTISLKAPNGQISTRKWVKVSKIGKW